MSALTAENVLPALILCGLAGMIGQGIRAVIGLKKAGVLQQEKMDFTQPFSSSYLMITLMIGFIAGSLSGLMIGIPGFVTDLKIEKLLAVVAAGYAGADFIEGCFDSLLKQAVSPPATGQQSQQGQQGQQGQ